MYIVRSDPAKNRLYMKIGKVTREEVDNLVADIRVERKKLVKGYTVLTDLTEFQPVSQSTARMIKKAQQVLIMGGMGKAARVVTSAVTRLQFERRDREVGYNAETVSTVEEGERFLDRWVRSMRPENEPIPSAVSGLPTNDDLYDWDERE
ncbi:MAG: hypothetical protein ACLFOY_01340 [Desulfatibacillaceae bacterium]